MRLTLVIPNLTFAPPVLPAMWLVHSGVLRLRQRNPSTPNSTGHNWKGCIPRNQRTTVIWF